MSGVSEVTFSPVNRQTAAAVSVVSALPDPVSFTYTAAAPTITPNTAASANNFTAGGDFFWSGISFSKAGILHG
ncbi:hypothetical protein D3C87_1650840 [compost metagenome]